MIVQQNLGGARPVWIALEVAVIATLALGCPKAEEEGSKKAAEPAKAAAPVKAEPAAPGGSSDPECIGAWTTEGALQKIDVGGKTYELQGAQLRETSTDADDQVIFGVIANIKEDTPENLKNVAAMVEFFKSKNVDAVIVDGDLGDSEQQIANVLDPIAAMDVPVLVVIGNQEKKADFNNGVKAVAARRSNVINMSPVRLVMLDDAAVVSMPGYFNKSYIHVENGCHYKPSDIEATRQIVKAAGDKPVMLVSHGPPLQKGPEAIDWTAEQANVGDPDLAKLIRETGVKFGVFANIREAGGHATTLDGATVIGEGKMAPELFLNPGPADAVGWKMNDRTESNGMAAVVTIKGKQAQFDVMRVPAS